MLWTAYINGGTVPYGEEFVRTVRDLADRAGIDLRPIDRPVKPDRRADLLQAFVELSQRELASERGAAAREYLEERGVSGEEIVRSDLGVVPDPARTRRTLEGGGYLQAEIAAAGILADSRWPGRLCGPWRNEQARVGTLWARTLRDTDQGDARYLYLRGASRTNLPPYGLSDVLASPRETRRDLILVEGLFDLHQLRGHGIENVAALGGLGTTPRTFERLSQLGVERVTLCLDRDEPGRTATARAVEQAGKAGRSPLVYVVDPERLAPADDPDAMVRQRGIETWLAAVEARQCGIVWRASEFLLGITPEANQTARRDALAQAGSWLGSLPPRLAVEQEDAVRVVSARSGYSPEAATRSFRARFWREPSLEPRPSMEPSTPSLES